MSEAERKSAAEIIWSPPGDITWEEIVVWDVSNPGGDGCCDECDEDCDCDETVLVALHIGDTDA